MEPEAAAAVQLWCPRPFGTFSQNQAPGATRRPPAAPKAPAAAAENTPPPPPPVPPPPPLDEGRVLLDTWYVIKPGNTKEKIAFFVAHQCGGARAGTMKVKGNWGGESCKAKRRRRSRGDADADANAKAGPGGPVPRGSAEPPDLLSVAELVALAEQRAALALQRPRAGPGAPVVLVADECRRVAEAVARFESRQRPPGATGAVTTAAAAAEPRPGEVRIAFRISSEARAAPPPGLAAKDKITCDLYQLLSPARDALPADVELLLATDAEEKTPPPSSSSSSSSSVRDCGFHVDVVVTGAVDECVFLGKDSSKAVTEETVCLGAEPPPPPPGQLFLPPQEAADSPEATATVSPPPPPPPPADSSLCRLYRHVSHDFLEIRFKIQRLLEPRQYMLLLPEHVMVKIFSYLPTRALAALKCSCHYFKAIIETFGVQAADSRWNRDPLYRDDPCKQCRKRYARGDVSLCRWHPKPYHHDLPYGRSYWLCCRRGEREAPGCRLGLHDNNWVPPGARPAARRRDGP
ncbi:F-box only protein 46 isoform X2 [Dromaius novaehollandiae]